MKELIVYKFLCSFNEDENEVQYLSLYKIVKCGCWPSQPLIVTISCLFSSCNRSDYRHVVVSVLTELASATV